MGWDRQAPEVVEAPAPIMLGRWVLAAGAAVLACALLFLLYASERVPLLQALNVWALSGAPLLIWVLAFGARAYVYGGALSHHQFLKEEAQGAQQSWQDWAQRYLAVHASCVLLPDQVSASVLTQGFSGLPPRTGQARRIAALPAQEERTQAGLQLLFPTLAPALQALPRGQELRVTLLSDADPRQYEALRDIWQQTWAAATRRPQPATVTLAAELSYQWIDETLKTASAAVELILVLQVHGEAAYSDGLAALLLCPDSLAFALELPVIGGLLRPMPLDIDTLNSELPLFLQTQTSACQAIGLLADGADWQPLTGKIFAAGGAHGASLKVEQQWIQESLCGLPGPLGHWLVTALGVEMARHQRRSLLVLTREESRHWISTVTTGELA
ncbi:hypothetical protein J3D54_005189 [Pseudomonas sp. GGS8]|uniref:hypothetical protein n=1 Tax=Pseudomonas sp. GGS8 TaxID=2817892 RepID=UPI00209C8D7E|nr:hypothetical protein [Pseudomonas sp. GGS8]MCP1446057.1 hypothetical protein [Pseudomonas sp. GGS8]